MNDFLLVFRADKIAINKMPLRSPEEMEANAKRWMTWIAGITAQGKLVDKGNRLFGAGKVLTADHVIADGPYTEIKECVAGYTIVRAASLEEATELSKGCPILLVGGSVEVREINPM